MTHILSWISNIIGMILVLCAHEHYTIDVIIAFTLATRVFSYYHTVSNTDPKKGMIESD
jgi:shingomyelin synthase